MTHRDPTLRLKYIFRPFVSALIVQVLRRQRMRRVASAVLRRLPGLRQRVLRVAVNTGLVSAPATVLAPWQLGFGQHMPADEDVLSPRVREIYADLKAIQERQGLD